MPMKRKRTRSHALAAVVAVVAIAAAGATIARADFRPGQYTHSSCAGTSASRVDPINFVYWDWGTIGRAVSQTEYHAGWTNSSGSGQYFFSHGECSYMADQRASGGTLRSRFHIRHHPIHWDEVLGW